MKMKAASLSTAISYRIMWTLLVLLLLFVVYAAARTQSYGRKEIGKVDLTGHDGTRLQMLRGRALDGNDDDGDDDDDDGPLASGPSPDTSDDGTDDDGEDDDNDDGDEGDNDEDGSQIPVGPENPAASPPEPINPVPGTSGPPPEPFNPEARGTP